MDANERIRDLLIVADGLCTVLNRENTLLRERKYDDIKDLVEEKTLLAKGLEAHYRGFEQKPEALDGADEDLREELKDVAERIEDLVKENGRRLQIAIQSGKTLMDVVSDAVRRSQPNAGTYSASGQVNKINSNSGGNASLSLNKSL
jgi:hypothetical protein